MTELQTRLRATLNQVAETTVVGPAPSFTAARRTRVRPSRRRAALAGVAALAVLGGGLSVAASAGLPVLPGPVMTALFGAPVPGAYHADPATGRVLLTVPGPDGVPLYLWYADANDHGYCVRLSSVVAPAASGAVTVDPTRMPRNGAGAGGCSGPVGDRYWNTFGGDFSGGGNGASVTFIVHVPGAARVELRLDDGTRKNLPVADDWTAGWLTRQQSRLHPELVGYAADGTQVGTFDEVFNPPPAHR